MTVDGSNAEAQTRSEHVNKHVIGLAPAGAALGRWIRVETRRQGLQRASDLA